MVYLSCPRCGGWAHGGYSCWIIGLAICLFPIGLLFLLTKQTYTCETCGYSYKV